MPRQSFLILIFLIVIVTLSACDENVSRADSDGPTATTIAESSNKSNHDSEFPADLFTPEQRKNGAIIFHCILAVYCFLAIATVCTEFFMPTIRRLCQVLKLSDDVAAATFMSIATSSPELFTNIIGTFVTDSDIGVGHVLGNAYYDMFFVAFLGGIAASQDILLDWWPITRDCGIYLIVTITLTCIVWDGKVEAYETIILLALYVLYFVIMFGNRAIIKWLRKCNINVVDPVDECNNHPMEKAALEMNRRKVYKETTAEVYNFAPAAEANLDLIQEADSTLNVTLTNPRKRESSKWKKCSQLLMLPLKIATTITIPDVRKPRCRNLYPISFVICVCWIGVSTYLGTWMISVIGETVGVPDIIMGMVFMAAGGSVVEAYGVYYKTRRGECSIGLSNSMGCNTLDATMCLALPWLVKILLYKGPGSSAITLASHVLHINCALLILSVIIMFAILYFSKFTLNWKMGVCSGVAYATVLTVAVFVEAYQLGGS